MTIEKAMYEFYKGIQVLGPGSESTTIQLAGLLPDKPNGLNAVDIGCGTGRSSIILAELGMNVTSLDDYQPFLDSLNEKALNIGVSDRIYTVNSSMEKLDLPENSFDLVWSEASVYVLGFENALKDWKKLLNNNGHIVVTECCWTTEKPHKENAEFWSQEYPEMLTVDHARLIAKELGYTIVYELTLHESDWSNYYKPLKKRIQELEKDAEPEMRQVIDGTRKEIRMRKKYNSEYDYIAFILQLSHKT